MTAKISSQLERSIFFISERHIRGEKARGELRRKP